MKEILRSASYRYVMGTDNEPVTDKEADTLYMDFTNWLISNSIRHPFEAFINYMYSPEFDRWLDQEMDFILDQRKNLYRVTLTEHRTYVMSVCGKSKEEIRAYVEKLLDIGTDFNDFSDNGEYEIEVGLVDDGDTNDADFTVTEE